MKKCRSCGKKLPLSEFYTYEKYHLGNCKKCHNAFCESRRNKVLKGLSDYRHSQRRVRKPWRASLEYRRKYEKEYRIKFPEKVSAHQAVHRAIRKGTLIRPDTCEDCGKRGSIEASHNDYSKPLEVNWLCKKCHRIKDNGIWAKILN